MRSDERDLLHLHVPSRCTESHRECMIPEYSAQINDGLGVCYADCCVVPLLLSESVEMVLPLSVCALSLTLLCAGGSDSDYARGIRALQIDCDLVADDVRVRQCRQDVDF